MVGRNQLLRELARPDLQQKWNGFNKHAYTAPKTHSFPIDDDRDIKGKLLLHLCDCGLQGGALR